MQPLVTSLDHLVLTVADLEASCAFYQRVLGFGVEKFGAGRVALTFGSQKINLHPLENDIDIRARTPTAGSGDLCFLTETPINEVKAHVEQCNVAVEMGPIQRTGATGPILSIYLRDPDGNLIEVANRVG
ncbi:MAG: VOC family protein [Rhodospirillaceae bacterium]|jgi:catechol 2,3-dioxygenase-like lactoylglutathione lyase family enzyme|nr:VOC family protein [Rhodospirillaceae bacterium]